MYKKFYHFFTALGAIAIAHGIFTATQQLHMVDVLHRHQQKRKRSLWDRIEQRGGNDEEEGEVNEKKKNNYPGSKSFSDVHETKSVGKYRCSSVNHWIFLQ